MIYRYILDSDGRPVVEPDVLKWGSWFEESTSRFVCREKVGDSLVSTVFTGINHGVGDGDPILWETMVFGGPLNEELDRCSGTKEDAMEMHRQMVTRVKGST